MSLNNSIRPLQRATVRARTQARGIGIGPEAPVQGWQRFLLPGHFPEPPTDLSSMRSMPVRFSAGRQPGRAGGLALPAARRCGGQDAAMPSPPTAPGTVTEPVSVSAPPGPMR